MSFKRSLGLILTIAMSMFVVGTATGPTNERVLAAPPSATDTFASGYSKIAVGYRHSCGVKTDGTVRCWGYNESREIGLTTQTYISSARPIEGITTAVDVSSGDRHSCALLQSGQVRCWGANGTGQLGDNTFESSAVPVTVVKANGQPLTGVVQIAAGAGFTCARLDSGSLSCWGHAWALGDGSDEDRGYAASTASFGSVIDVSASPAGTKVVCAVVAGGDVYCWGSHFGYVTKIGLPTKKDGIAGATSVLAADRHACASLTDKSIRCWGMNFKGELGPTNVSDDINTVTGLAVESLGDGGGSNSCVVTTDRKAKCWGDGWSGKLGNGSTTDRSSPVSVKTDKSTELSNVAQVSMGESQACALSVEGDVYCWGSAGFTARPWAVSDETSFAGRIAENPKTEILDTTLTLDSSGSPSFNVTANLKYCDNDSASYEVRLSLSASMSDATSLTGSICRNANVTATTELRPASTYYYRVDVRSIFGNASSVIKSFISKGKKPALTLVPFSPFEPVSPSESKARVPFSYDGDGLEGSFGLPQDCELSKSPSMATNDTKEVERTVIQSDGVERNKNFLSLRSSSGTFVCTYLGLEPSTTYYYRVTLMNKLGSTSSDIGSFTTRKRSGISIDSGALYTNTPKVRLILVLPQIKVSAGVLVANDGGFTKAESFSQTTEYPDFTASWTLDSAGDERLPKTVYVRYTSASGDLTTLTDDIILDTRPPAIEAVKSNDGSSGLSLEIKATDDNSGLEDVQVESGGVTSTMDYSSSVSIPTKSSVAKSSVGVFASKTVRVRVSDKAGNWSAWMTPGATPTSKLAVGASTKATSLATLAKIKVAAGSRLTLKAAGASVKICRVSSDRVVGVGPGSCKVTVTVAPKAGKPTSKTVTLTIAKK